MDALETTIIELQLTEVFAVGDYDYEWAEFKAWRAPSGRLYWYDDSGCSCTSFGERFSSAADLGDGERDELERAFRQWAGENMRCPAEQVIEGLEKIKQLQSSTY